MFVEEDIAINGLEMTNYRYLQQMAKAMSLPSNVKKVYLIEMINAKKYSTEEELNEIVNRVKMERKINSQTKKNKQFKMRSRLQCAEVTSACASVSPVPLTTRGPSDILQSSPEGTVVQSQPHIINTTTSILRPLKSDRVLRSFNTGMRPNYRIMEQDSSVCVVTAQNTVQEIRTERFHSVTIQKHRPLINANILVNRKQSLSAHRTSNVPPQSSRRERRLSGIYPLQGSAEPYYEYIPTNGFRTRHGRVSKIKAIIQKPCSQSPSLPGIEPKQNHVIVTVQDVIDYRTNREVDKTIDTDDVESTIIYQPKGRNSRWKRIDYKGHFPIKKMTDIGQVDMGNYQLDSQVVTKKTIALRNIKPAPSSNVYNKPRKPTLQRVDCNVYSLSDTAAETVDNQSNCSERQPTNRTQSNCSERQPTNRTQLNCSERQPTNRTQSNCSERQPTNRTQSNCSERQPTNRTQSNCSERQPTNRTQSNCSERQPTNRTQLNCSERQPTNRTQSNCSERQPTNSTQSNGSERQPTNRTQSNCSERQPTNRTQSKCSERQPTNRTQSKCSERQPTNRTQSNGSERQPTNRTYLKRELNRTDPLTQMNSGRAVEPVSRDYIHKYQQFNKERAQRSQIEDSDVSYGDSLLEYPNMASITDVFPNEYYCAADNSTNSKYSIYLPKQIRDGQVGTSKVEVEQLPRIDDVFSQFKDVEFKNLSRPLYVKVGEEAEKAPLPVIANTNNTGLLETLYNFRNQFVINPPLLNIVTTHTQPTYTVHTVTTAVANSGAADRSNCTRHERASRYHADNDCAPQINERINSQTTDWLNTNFGHEEVAALSSPLDSPEAKFPLWADCEATVPELDDVMEMISQDGDYMERIGMDVRIQCVRCDWAGPSLAMDPHIKKEHVTNIQHEVSREWSVAFTPGQLMSRRIWWCHMIQHRECLFLVSAIYRDNNTVLVSLSQITYEDDSVKRCRITVFNKITGKPYSYESEINYLPTVPQECNETYTDGLILDLGELDLIPSDATKTQGNGELPDYDNVEFVVHVKLLD